MEEGDVGQLADQDQGLETTTDKTNCSQECFSFGWVLVRGVIVDKSLLELADRPFESSLSSATYPGLA